ncbi:MAG: NADP transhydrogenase subunit alpha [Euryarchaeota archaeon RBG_16_62_10]|nr:MAG: NADP transhydrogenase subunit alpha [Euryarchaeota archaeon RBG_16_62_10]
MKLTAKRQRHDSRPTFAVLGAGHGGLAMAGHLALMGFPVRLWNRSAERIEHVIDRGGIDMEGVVEGLGRLDLASNDISEVLDGADVVMVVVPASGHRYVAEQCAPYLKSNHVVVLNPGRTFGALEFIHVLREKKAKARPTVSEAQTFIYVSRHADFAKARILQIKNSVPLAAIPAHRTPYVLSRVRNAFPQFVAASNVLETSLDNIGAIFHPGVTILNAARIESTHGDFEYYLEGVSPSSAKILEAADAERVALGAALGIHLHTARQWLYLAYDSPGKSLHDAIQATPGYKGVRAPATLTHRYLLEDVPMSLVPMASVGKQVGVRTPTIEALIHLASIIHARDFWSEGRTVRRVGLHGMSVKDIRILAVRGVPR